jgi:hypothetical protein
MDSAEVEAEIKRASSLDPLTEDLQSRIYVQCIGQAIRDASEKDKFSSLHIISIDLYTKRCDHLLARLDAMLLSLISQNF